MSKIVSLVRGYAQRSLMLGYRVMKRSPDKLEFGCGSALKSGYEGVDTRALKGVRYVCEAWNIDRYVKPNSVSEISSRHFLEHLTFAQVDATLAVWRRLLKADGNVVITVPDIQYHIQQFVSKDDAAAAPVGGGVTVRQHALAGFWGWQRDGMDQYWDVHKSGFSEDTLYETLDRFGFSQIQRLDDEPWNLTMRACRKWL